VGLRSLLVFERMCRDVAQLRGDSAPWIGDRVGSVDPAPSRSHDREASENPSGFDEGGGWRNLGAKCPYVRRKEAAGG